MVIQMIIIINIGNLMEFIDSFDITFEMERTIFF